MEFKRIGQACRRKESECYQVKSTFFCVRTHELIDIVWEYILEEHPTHAPLTKPPSVKASSRNFHASWASMAFWMASSLPLQPFGSTHMMITEKSVQAVRFSYQPHESPPFGLITSRNEADGRDSVWGSIYLMCSDPVKPTNLPAISRKVSMAKAVFLSRSFRASLFQTTEDSQGNHEQDL